MSPSSTDMHAAMLENGYVVYKNVFTAEEIQRMRQAVLDYFETHGRYAEFGKTQSDAFPRVPALRWVASHPKLIKAFHECTGNQDLKYTFHSDIHMNLLSGWHTDTQAYFDPKEVLRDDFAVYKVGIYLQDHLHNSHGLTVCEKSHRTGTINRDNVKAISSAAGDIIIFDVRIYHHGDKKSFLRRIVNKAIPSDKLKHTLDGRLRRLLGKPDKLSLFFTYGVDNDLTREFSIRNMKRQNKQNNVSGDLEADASMVASLKDHGISTVQI